MPAQFRDSPEFQKLLVGANRSSLIRIALEIAADAYPNLDIELYMDKADKLAERVRAVAKRGLNRAKSWAKLTGRSLSKRATRGIVRTTSIRGTATLTR